MSSMSITTYRQPMPMRRKPVPSMKRKPVPVIEVKLKEEVDPLPEMAMTYDYLTQQLGADPRKSDAAFENAWGDLLTGLRMLAEVSPEDQAIRDGLRAAGLPVYDTATYVEAVSEPAAEDDGLDEHPEPEKTEDEAIDPA